MMPYVFNILTALGVFLGLGIIAGVVFGLAGFPGKDEKKEPKIRERKSNLYAFVRCSGGDSAHRRYTYADADDCRIADSLYGGLTSCGYACLGLGNCKVACRYGAIRIENGVAVVDSELCNGCGECVMTCPRGVIELVPKTSLVAVACNNPDAGYDLREICGNGCIGCRECANTCKDDAIGFEGDLAFVDYDKCTNCGECAKTCVRGVISAPITEEEQEEFLQDEVMEFPEALPEEEPETKEE